MTEKHPIRNGIIATVVGGVILAALGRLWPPASWLLAAIGHGLTTTVLVPMWLLVLAGAFVVVVFVRLRRAFRSHAVALSAGQPHSDSTTESSRTALPDDLSIFEREVFARIAKDDGEAVPRDTVKRSLGATNLRLQATVDRLVQKELVEELESVDDPDDVVLALTSKGRQYAVQHGLA